MFDVKLTHDNGASRHCTFDTWRAAVRWCMEYPTAGITLWEDGAPVSTEVFRQFQADVAALIDANA